MQGAGDGVLVYFPGLVDAVFGPREVLARRRRLFGPWLEARTLWIVSRRRPLPARSTIDAMAADYAAAVAAIVAREGGAREGVDVAGASLGGCIALRFALDHPAQVRSLIVQQAAARGDPQVQRLAREWIEQLQDGRYFAFATSVLGHSRGGRSRQWNDSLALFTFPLVVNGFARRTRDLVRSLEAIDGFDVSAELGSLEVPTMVIGGEADALAPPYLLRETAAAIPSARLRLLAEAGHSVQAECRDEYAQAVVSFLEAVAAGRSPSDPPGGP